MNDLPAPGTTLREVLPGTPEDLDQLADMGARNVLITHPGGCFARLRPERGRPMRFRATGPEVEVNETSSSSPMMAASVVLPRPGGP